MSPATESTAALIREWVSVANRAAGPKPMALPFLTAGDPVALARITLCAIREGILTGDMGLARLALVVAATAEHEAAGGDRRPRWGTEAQVRVGLALIDCAMRASAGWLCLRSGTDGRLVVSVAGGPHPFGHASELRGGRWHGGSHLSSSMYQEVSWRPTLWPLAPPYRVLRTIMGWRSVTLALTEAADADLPGGGFELACAVPLGRA